MKGEIKCRPQYDFAYLLDGITQSTTRHGGELAWDSYDDELAHTENLKWKDAWSPGCG